MPSRKRKSKGPWKRRRENVCGSNHLEVDPNSTVAVTTNGTDSELPPESPDFETTVVVTTREPLAELSLKSQDIDSREVVTTIEPNLELLPVSPDFDITEVVTTTEADFEPSPKSQEIDSTDDVTTIESDFEMAPESLDSTEVVTTLETHAEEATESIEPIASRKFDNTSGTSTESDSSRSGSVNCLASGKNDQTECNGSDRNSGTLPPYVSEDSGFTSSCENDSFQDGESALRNLGIGMDYGRHHVAALPQRPGRGTFGKRIKLISNLYPINYPSGNVYHYDLEIVRFAKSLNPGAKESKKYRCLRTKEKRKVVELMVETDAVFQGLYPAFDGEKKLITRQPLCTPFPHVFTTDYEDGTTRVSVEIKPVKKKDTTSCAISLDAIHSYFEGQIDSVPAESITALETILRHMPCLMGTPIGRSFFSPPGPGCMHPLSGGLEIWFGYHQSLRISEWGPTVNLDVSSTVFFPEGPLINYIARFLNTTVDALRNTPFMADRDRNRLSRKLKDRKVEATHSRVHRKYTIMELTRESAHTLRLDNGGQTVAQYFREQYRIRLEFPNLPCLRVKPKEKRVYLPIELCKLVSGQHYNHELTRAQMSEMIKYTCSLPKQRFQKISSIREGRFEEDRCARNFGLEVSQDPLHIEGRILDSPSLIYGSDQKIRPQADSWNMRGIQFFKGAAVDSWALLAFPSIRMDALVKFAKLMEEMGRKLGLRMGEPDRIQHINGIRHVRKSLLRMREGRGRDLVVVVVPETDEEAIYREVKTSAETDIGLITQCIREKNVLKTTDPGSRCAGQLLGNLFLKINAKMEGVNYSLVLSEIPSVLWKPTIVMGADVNHPGCYRGLRESLAACSGSLDARCSIYAVRTMPQKNPDARKGSSEIISDLQSMTKDLLRAFYRHTRQKPEKIIFYRDGVSEGEFGKVRKHEVASLRLACEDIQKDYKPGITFIVVQKRHHVRFMTEESKLNVPKGTVVDEGVTHPKNFDFFLFSHKSGKGTARPAHYTVLADDNGFTADDLQKLTNQLCYSNVRCTKSVSIPAPVAYAHLAAYRARQYLKADRDGSTSGDSKSSHFSSTLEDSIEITTVVQEMKNRMYFV